MIGFDEFYLAIEKLSEALTEFCNITGLHYDYENEEYMLSNVRFLEDLDDEMLASIENACADVKYFLGQN